MDISIIIPSFNSAFYIEECLLSVVYHDCVKEIVVIDDGSTDGSLKIIEHIQSTNPKIKLLYNGRNRGRSYTRNIGILNASCQWIGFCDADDYFLPCRFDSWSLIKESFYDGYYSSIETAYDHSSLRSKFKEKRTGISSTVLSSELFEFLILNPTERFSLNGLIVRKTVLLKIGLFDTSLNLAEDTDIIWRLAFNFTLTSDSLSKPVAIRRIHQENTITDIHRMTDARYSFYRKWSKLIPELSSNTHVINSLRIRFFSNWLLKLKLNNAHLWLIFYFPLRLVIFFLKRRYP